MSRTRAELEADRATRDGCVQLRTCRATGVEVGIYRSLEAGMESDPATPWSVVCEKHATLVSTETKAQALSTATDTRYWCDECRAERPEECS